METSLVKPHRRFKHHVEERANIKLVIVKLRAVRSTPRSKECCKEECRSSGPRTNGFVHMKRITVLLADDYPIVREELRLLLEEEGDFEVVGEAENGRQAVQLTRKLRPSVVVMDLSMPLLNGLEATQQILKVLPSTKVLILSMHDDGGFVKQAAKLGAAGYVLKETAFQILPGAIRNSQNRNTFFSPSSALRKSPKSEPALPVH